MNWFVKAINWMIGRPTFEEKEVVKDAVTEAVTPTQVECECCKITKKEDTAPKSEVEESTTAKKKATSK